LQEDPTTFYPSDTVRAESHATLEAVVGILKKWHGIKKLTVEGNTCTNGELSWNKALSRDRATAVKRFLVEPCGMPASKLSIEGHGPSKPLAEAHRSGVGTGASSSWSSDRPAASNERALH